MGGDIAVESEIGQGSHFHATLRLEPAPETADDGPAEDLSDALPAATPFRSLRRFRILTADDIEENIELAEIRLRGQGHSVIAVRNGKDAVAMFEDNDFDVILMDIHMPEMDGLAAMRRIRSLEQGVRPAVPIVALSASVLLHERRQCFDAGATEFIAKPVDFDGLFQVMERIVPAGRGELAGAPATPMARESLAIPERPGIDIVDGLLRWSDAGRYHAALLRFAPKYAETPGQLARLYADGDWSSAWESAHALKGAAANLAVSDVARIAGALNDAFKARRDAGIDAMIDQLAASLTIAAA